MSLFTGTYPSAHGTHIAYKTSPPTVYPVARDLELLPEIMRRAGYRTAAWTGGGQVSSTAGFDRGFDQYSEDLGDIDPWKMNEVRAWFRRNSDEPCFLFIHTYQIHDPYLPPPPYNQIFASDYEGWVIGDKKVLQTTAGGAGFEDLYHAFWRTPDLNPDPASVGPDDLQQLVALYDGGIRYTDDVLHGFFEDLRQDGLLDNTLVVVFSDHGEEFLEHYGLLHEKLYRETLHVPLILFWPAGLPGDIVIQSQVPLIDLGPTLLDLAVVETPPLMEGRSLLPLLQDPVEVNHRFAFSEEPWVHDGHHRSIRDGSHMLYDHGTGEIELFSVVEDPFERENIFPTHPELAVEMDRRLLEFITAHDLLEREPQEEARELSSDEIEALRALGYIE
jgi:arylsulfatase A-like enzyme